MVHPERVAACVSKSRGNHIGVIGAWLHDVIEDCADGELVVLTTLEKTDLPLEDRPEIYIIVSALTRNPAIPDKEERLMDSARRITIAPPQATLIKLCDRTDNLIEVADVTGSVRYVNGCLKGNGLIRCHSLLKPF